MSKLGSMATMFQGGHEVAAHICECGTVALYKTFVAAPVPYIIVEPWCPTCNEKIEGLEGRVIGGKGS